MDGIALTIGEPGEPPATAQELEERLKVVEEKVRRDSREIIEVLRIDFPRFIERVIKDRFLGAHELADGFKDAQLKALKEDVAKAGAKAVAEIVPTLEEWGLWLNAGGTLPSAGERRDLSGNAEIHGRIQRIGAFVREVLERHGFPGLREDEFRDAYRMPTWFISGRLVVSLIESYWRNVEEYQGVASALGAMKDRDLRSKRAERWDSV